MDLKYNSSYKDGELEKVQVIELGILKEFSRICSKYKLEWIAIGGTALGAVRHSGFIPWDDDIDVAMRRNDYEKFIHIAPGELSKQYFLQNFVTEPNCNNYFTKIRKNGTLFVEECGRSMKAHQGIFIDIFPLDNLPKDNRKLKKLRFNLFFWYQLYMSKTVIAPASQLAYWKKIAATFCRTVLHFALIIVPKKALFQKVDQLFQKYNDKEADMIGFVYLPGMSLKLSEFYPIRKMRFADMEIAMPNDYDAYLRRDYGDYMTLPKEANRINHRPIILKL